MTKCCLTKSNKFKKKQKQKKLSVVDLVVYQCLDCQKCNKNIYTRNLLDFILITINHVF